MKFTKLITVFCLLFCFTAISNPVLAETSEPPIATTGTDTDKVTESFDVNKEMVTERNKAFSGKQGVSEEDIARYNKISNQILSDLDLLAKQKTYKEQFIKLQKSAPSDLAKKESLLANFKDFNPEKEKDRVEGISLTDAETTLSEIQTQHKSAKVKSSDLENEPQRRAKRITEIPELISKLQENLAALKQKGTDIKVNGTENTISYIESLKNKVSAELNSRTIEALQEELKAYEAMKNLLPLERDLASRELNFLEKKLNFWQDAVNTLRKKKLEEIKKEAVTATKQVKYSNEAVKNIAKEINDLTRAQAELLATMESTTQHLQSISAKLKKINDDYLSTKKLISRSEKVTSTTGMLLLTKQESLPKIKQNIKNIKNRFEQISAAQLNWRVYDENWSRLLEIDNQAKTLLNEAGLSESDTDYKINFDEMTTVLNQKRKILGIIAGYYNDYLTLLAQVDAQERDLVDVVEKYNLFISKNILWVKSGSSFDKKEFMNSLEVIRAIFTKESLNKIWLPVKDDITKHYAQYSLTVLLAIFILCLHNWFLNKIRSYADKIKKTDTDLFSHTLKAMFLSIVASIPAAILLLFITWRYAITSAISGDYLNILEAFKSLTFITFIFFLLRWFTINDGLGYHLRLDKKVLSIFRFHIVWLYLILITLRMMYGIVQNSDLNMEVKNSGLSFLFIIQQISITIFLMILFNPKGDFSIRLQESGRGSVSRNIRYVWFIVIISIPFTFCMISIIGYSQAALHLHYKFTATLLFYLTVLFLNRMLLRGLFISRRRLALKKAAEKKEIQSTLESSPDLVPLKVKHEEKQDSILNISKQTRQIINVLSTLLVIAGIWMIWKSTLPALEAFENIQLWQTYDKSGATMAITLGNAIKAIVIIILTVFTAKNIPGLLEITILQKLNFNSGARFAFTSLSKYLISAIGIVYSFSSLGIKWETVQWLAAAVTVGLGFGLQEIFANFISGLIILFEQPIRVGDFVTIGDISGEVTKIKIRATTILKWDRKELLVPNKEFITGRLVNWTLSDQILRLEFPVGVAYGSDIKKTEAVLYDIAKKCKQAIHETPIPRVIFKGFGDSCLDFELRVYIKHVKDYLDVWHQINCNIDTEFRKNHIEIAFPQRDLHLKSIEFPLPTKS